MARQFKRSVTLAATVSLALGGVLITGPQAQAAQAAQKALQLDCGDKEKTLHAHVSLVGSGAPTARYDVKISVVDLGAGNPPKARLITANQDGSRTIYPWYVGDVGKYVQSYWDTTLQQPKGLKYVILEAHTYEGVGTSGYACSDYGPK
ncbi:MULTISPECIES: hypothetical protein [unclassified Streptomyces]|uniref:hypothetical protein n=1 Tax=unclassified Streptomyces TaxID=2593676 RepID=UPI003822A2FB